MSGECIRNGNIPHPIPGVMVFADDEVSGREVRGERAERALRGERGERGESESEERW